MEKKIEFLEEKARDLRTTVLTMIHEAGSGHPGGSLSASDYVTVLYYDEMNIDPKNPRMENRDRFVLSKGHCCPVLYSVLALKGFYDYEIIHTLRKFGSILQGHPDMNKVPGIDMTTGSLGQGLSVGVGMAIGLKRADNDARVFVAIGDGELNEGQIWEAAATAAKYKLDNVVAIIDFNGIQNDSFTKDIMPMNDIASKWRSFGWEVLTCDGHSIRDLVKIFDDMKQFRQSGRPICLVAKTVKGKGVSFMENVPAWHGVAPNVQELSQALKEINGGVC